MSAYQRFDPNANLACLSQAGEVSNFSDISSLSPEELKKLQVEWELIQMQYCACIQFRLSPEHRDLPEAMLEAELDAFVRMESRLLELRRLLGK